MTTREDDLVQVLVPRRHLTAVYAFIAEREGALDVAVPAPVPAPADDDAVVVDAVPWTVEDLRRFARTPSAMNVTLCKVLDVLAEDPGQYFATSDLEELTGIPRSNLRGAFSALTRHVRAHYSGRGWMLSRTWGPLLDPENPLEACYRLDDEQAARWRQARGSLR
ncbi:hypothetical protein NUM3379_28650 [Kineococcus sp. NUM-3379]